MQVIDVVTLRAEVTLVQEYIHGAALSLLDLSPKSHETTPPPRYTDASLVKRLEDDGIGRPSTYASIIKTILERGYVWRQGKALCPTFTAFVVTLFLKEHFRRLVELDFTGRIEEKLDLISNGDLERMAFLREFYFGDGLEWLGLKNMVEKESNDWGDYPSYPVGEDPATGKPLRNFIRVVVFGSPQTRWIRVNIDPASSQVFRLSPVFRAPPDP